MIPLDVQNGTDFASGMGQTKLHADRGGSDGIMGAVQRGLGARTALALSIRFALGAASKRTHRGRSQACDTELLLYSQIEFRERGARYLASPRRLWDDG